MLHFCHFSGSRAINAKLGSIKYALFLTLRLWRRRQNILVPNVY
jgi:hypothetical protein